MEIPPQMAPDAIKKRVILPSFIVILFMIPTTKFVMIKSHYAISALCSSKKV